MPSIDFSHLSQQERLDLIEALWDSLDRDMTPVTTAQKAEIQRRLEALDQDTAQGLDAADVLADLRSQHSG